MRLFVLLLCFVTLISWDRQMSVVSDGVTVYKVEKTDNIFPWDQFVGKVETIPLETNDNSLIGEFHKGIIIGNDIYIFDFRHQTLLNFDIAGNFKKKISGKGKGPEEYYEARDFCVVGDNIYVLDYLNIHRYNKSTGKKENTWSYDTRDNFNPVNMFVFDKNNYFLWDGSPHRNPKGGKSYMMHKMQGSNVSERFFPYEHPSWDEPKRFHMIDGQSCYIRPINGEDIVYKLTKDSLIASFKIDFGQMAAGPIVEDLTDITRRNTYFKSNKFKSISSVLEVKDYIYFSCFGPDAFKYEGIISKHTGNVRFGMISVSPTFFFSDGTFLYGYYDQSAIDILKENNVRHCFESVWLNENQYNIEDNIVLVKVLLK